MTERLPAKAIATLSIAIGGAALAFGDPSRAWGAFLFNLVFWISTSAGAMALSAAIRVCNGKWAQQLHPVAHIFSRVLWLTVVLLLLLPIGASAIYVWASSPVPGLEGWLAPVPLFARDAVALLVLAFVAHRSAREATTAGAAGSRSVPQRAPRGPTGRTRWAVALILTYAVVLTLLSVDLVMSLEPRWVSTLFGAHIFIGGGYAALAGFAVLGVWPQRRLETEVRHDVGKLLFAFCLLWTYFFWSQYLVIWYGNLSREASFWARRTDPEAWRAVAVFVLVACFVVPFLTLLSRSNKRKAARLAGVASFVLVGMLAERFLLVMPSVLPDGSRPIGWAEPAVTAGFLGAVAWTLRLPPASSAAPEATAEPTVADAPV